ncbi:MAG: hypothetical protein ACRDY0_04875 [Acidimicrobiales bacterium]
MRIVAHVPDLIDRSKVAAAAEVVGAELVLVRSAAGLAEAAAAGADLVVLDLGRAGVLDAIAGLGETPTVGFASHVDADLIRRARAAGCGRVLARSAFFGHLPQALTGSSGGGPAPG